jgi:hypothetical protein
MYVQVWRRVAAPIVVSLIVFASTAAAQTGGQAADPHQGHHMPATDPGIPDSRQGSGTSWLPDQSVMRAIHSSPNGWMVMTHFNAFAQYLHESGERGSSQTGSINWLMTMATRSVGGGSLAVRGMISVEPWTIGGCGYPDLLATGEFCEGAAIHDRQHPHDLFMEIAAEYQRPLGRGVHLQVYGGPAGEPALGPVAYMHRESGFANALAPITHHWFDSTHITYGVATVGVFSRRWKLEGSLFNGREPDDDRIGFDFGAMDSWSSRLWWMPSPRWALQVSGGRLNEVEPGHDDDPAVDANRFTASATYHRAITTDARWATTMALGRNAEAGGDATIASLIETTVSRNNRDAIYGRFEWVEKSAHDLAVPGHDVFNVAKVQAGYTRYFKLPRNLVAGPGAAVSIGIVPRELESTYGRRVNPGVGVYLNVMPGTR